MRSVTCGGCGKIGVSRQNQPAAEQEAKDRLAGKRVPVPSHFCCSADCAGIVMSGPWSCIGWMK